MASTETFQIELHRIGLGTTSVVLDGELIGDALDIRTARRPKTWFAVKTHDGSHEVLTDLGGFTNDTAAAFALVQYVNDKRKAERIVARFAGAEA